MGEEMEKVFSRKIESLSMVFDFIESFCAKTGIGDSVIPNVNLVIEELFTNAVKYSPKGADIGIRLEKESDQIVMCLVDRDVDAFDLTKAPEVDTGAPAEERRVGGLGIHLIRKLVRDMTYEYKDRNSLITVKMALED
jgi:anti-sigma regulatory factor (Ser/Thr protein kinase)